MRHTKRDKRGRYARHSQLIYLLTAAVIIASAMIITDMPAAYAADKGHEAAELLGAIIAGA